MPTRREKREARAAQQDSEAPPVAQTVAMPPAPTPVVMQRNELKQTWVEPIVIDRTNESPAPPPLQSIAFAEDEGPPIDPIETFLKTLDLEQGYMLRVDRLPKWEADGRAGLKAPKEFCRQYQFDLENFLNLIADEYGAGHYWLTLRRMHDGAIMKNWVEHIAPKVEKPAPAQLSGFSVLPQSHIANQSPLAQIKEMAEFAKTIRAINDSLGIVTIPPAPAPAPAQTQAPPDTLRDRLLSAFIDRAANKGDDASLDRILGALIGKEEPRETGFDFLGLLERIAAPLMPALAQLLMNPAMRPGAIAPPMQPALSPAPSFIPPPPGAGAPRRPGVSISPVGSVPLGETLATAAPSPIGDPPQTEGGEDDMDEPSPVDVLLDNLVTELTGMSRAGAVDMLAVERGAVWVRKFAAEFPAASVFVQGLIYGTPVDVLNSLAAYHEDFAMLPSVPLASTFVELLQQKLRGQ